MLKTIIARVHHDTDDDVADLRATLAKLSREEAVHALQKVAEALYHDGPETEWSADTCSEVALSLDLAVGRHKRNSVASRLRRVRLHVGAWLAAKGWP